MAYATGYAGGFSDAVTVSLVQQATNASTAGATACGATFASATTAGNFLVMIIAGDKNTGTLTATGWDILVSLPTAAVSLYIATKVSTGETTVAASTSSPASAGHSTWIGEYSEAGSGAWTIFGSATNPSNGTTA